jgi:tRNA(Ile)-lysidine synthase
VVKEFKQYIEQQKLCNLDNRILVAVSGGIDSVVMLDLFVEASYQIAIAHCNFQLRGKESDGDEQFVKNLGEKYGIKVFAKSFETKDYANYQKLSIQEAARDLRYSWFEELLYENDFDYVAVGQHADDQVETFFINLLRGSGLAGLRGMPLKRGNIIRPLLFANRKQIIMHTEENDLNFREDSSNKEDTYLRNKIRLNLLPELEKLHTKAPVAIVESMNNLNEADVLLKQLMDEKYNSLFSEKEGFILVSKDDVVKLQPMDSWLFYLMKRFGFNRDTTNSMTDAIIRMQIGQSFVSETHEAIIDRKNLLIRPMTEIDLKEYFVQRRQDKITDPLILNFERIPNSETFKIKSDARVAQLDEGKLTYPLKIRRWQHGDRFTPFGMKGSKLLSDFFIDNKINLFEKQNIWLLISGNDIVWVIGHRISEKYKITRQTETVLAVTCCSD